jgi:hypothetical protein
MVNFYALLKLDDYKSIFYFDVAVGRVVSL